MKVLWSISIGFLAGGIFLPLSGRTAPAPTASFTSNARFTSKVTVTPGHAKVGKAANFSVVLVNKGPSVSDANVDLEIYGAKNKKIVQQVWPAQSLAKGKGGAYHWMWKPTTAGTYTVKFGVFSHDWKTLRYWDDKALLLPAS